MRSLHPSTIFLGLLACGPAHAEVVSSSDTHFVLHHEMSSNLPQDRLWERLVNPAQWWHPDHTYSGDAGNLTLSAEAGGLWREDWSGGSVAHGEVLFVQEGEVLRLEAPFGPLQGLGAYTVWTITIKSDDEGSLVLFDEIASAPPGSNMVEMAKAVDYVKSEAIQRLTSGQSAP